MHIVIFYISNQSVHRPAFVILSWIWHPSVLNCLHNSDNNNNTNTLFITKLTIKTYLQLISLKKKKNIFSQSAIYKSFHFIKLLFILIKKNSCQLKKKPHLN